MSWRDLVTAARSCVVGWGALFAIIFLIERPLLYLAASIVDASWLPTVELALDPARTAREQIDAGATLAL